MKPGARLAILESSFFLLLASIITFSLIGWRELALFLSAIFAVAARLGLNYYYECIAECGSLSAKISVMPIITFVALTLSLISFRQHPFLVAALFLLLFILVIWKVAMLLNWIDRGRLKASKE
jgi:hypothetical protein